MYQKAKQHFKKYDPKLFALSEQIELPEIEQSSNLFRDIVWTITGQQLSSRAADTIFSRVKSILRDKAFSPENLLNESDETLRGCGLSYAKIRTIRAFSAAIVNRDLHLEELSTFPDDEVIRVLTKIKGIGPWTAEMVLIFSLGRHDIFSKGDLGLKKGMLELYGLQKMPAEQEIETILRSWSPYRTYAARLLWKLSDKKTDRKARKKPM